jgi:hypothetical protein
MISSKSLREGEYLDLLPEFYTLSEVTENNAWHDRQSVFEHVVKVLESLEILLDLKFLEATRAEWIARYLSERIGQASRKDLLVLATVLHDIAKTDTLVRGKDGKTSCPGHALIGAARVSRFAERLRLDSQSARYVERIVRYHGLVSDILDLIIANNSREKYLRIFQETVGDVAVELILFMYADLLGSDLEEKDKRAFDERVRVLTWMLGVVF